MLFVVFKKKPFSYRHDCIVVIEFYKVKMKGSKVDHKMTVSG